jgi:hypothetical protein
MLSIASGQHSVERNVVCLFFCYHHAPFFNFGAMVLGSAGQLRGWFHLGPTQCPAVRKHPSPTQLYAWWESRGVIGGSERQAFEGPFIFAMRVGQFSLFEGRSFFFCPPVYRSVGQNQKLFFLRPPFFRSLALYEPKPV